VRTSLGRLPQKKVPMSSPGSVTLWIVQLKAGASDAAQPLWEKYFRRPVGVARDRLAGVPRRAADEEDVALSAFDSFYRAAAQGRFPDLHNRDDLWRLLMLITDRKACDLANYERRQRRGGGKVLDEAALRDEDLAAAGTPLALVRSKGPGPELVLQTAEECRRLLGALGDDDLRQVAVLKLEGHTVEEIAAQLGRVPRAVKRRLHMIRKIWEQELPA
jgi:DNA-directed RNA polymerase specialized sigma24 family protein